MCLSICWQILKHSMVSKMMRRNVFITGGTGYIGQRLIPLLLQRGHRVRALVRKGSEHKLPHDCSPVVGNALDKSTFANSVKPADTFVQLVGVSHTSPSKVNEFRTVDLVSVRASVQAASGSGVDHFVYISVAHPAPTMKAYIEVRREGESMIRGSGMNATFIRPWYVLGPGHRWPYVLLPAYWLCELLPPTRDGARRLGLVTLRQMVNSIIDAVENPAKGTRILGVPEIRRARLVRINDL